MSTKQHKDLTGTDLHINNPATVSTATTGNAFSITGSSLTTGSLAYFYSNSADTSNRSLLHIINDNPLASGTSGIFIQQDGIGANVSGLFIGGGWTTGIGQYTASDTLTTGGLATFTSNSADTSARQLVSIINDNALATGTGNLYLQNDANSLALQILSATTTYTHGAFFIQANSLTTGHVAEFYSNSADGSVRHLVLINNVNAAADAAICLKLTTAGDGQQILGTGNENLSNAGVWTDRTSTYADKTDITPLAVTGFIDKLKALKLFEYRKKCEVYGNKQDILHETEKDETGKAVVVGKEYPEVIKHIDAPLHKGYILDDPSTPEELISRNVKGEIDGMSGTQNCNFLLAVCKELISRVELLEKSKG